FTRNRGTMTGIVKVGTGAGQFIIPLAVSLLIAGYGWRTAFAILSASVSSLLFFIALLLRRDPGRPGPGPDGKKTAWRDKQDSAGQGLSIRETIRTRQFGTVCIVNLNTVFCLMIIMVHIVPHARDFGASGAVGAGVLATIGGVSMAGRFITGIAVDRMGSRKAMIVCLHLLIGALLWLQVADELWMLYLFAVVYGMAHGGFFTAISPLVAEFFGITAHGLLFGIVSFSGNVGGAAGPVLAGYIFDLTAAYQAVFWLCTLLSGLGLGLIWSLKPIR
ncbi:MAG: MFS transporter, partial [Desulfobacterales bacterium]|nr:MFS transporter [Desulfobacterales bacterium]